MDDFPDRTCPMSSWSHMGGVSRASWDFNDKIISNAESIEIGVGNHKASGTGQTSGSQTGATKDTINYPLEDNMQLLLEDQLMTSRLLYQQGYQGSLAGLTDGSASQALSVAAIYSQALATSPSVGSSGTEISNGQQPSGGQLPSGAATWCQPFVGGTIPLQFGSKTELFLQQQTQAGGHQNSLLTAIGGTKSNQPQTGVLASQRPQEETSLSVSGGRVGVSQPQSAATGAGGPGRPRVRARRGQATDPHSIAERLRRERIADRMKSLQELVPNANKADRASMLDEIIDYVKFLQLQVKVLSMSRLGGTGAVTPLLSDLTPEGLLSPGIVQNSGASSSQDGLAVIERQVARLMEENMGSAMQYLQGKGLCLMPLSVAAAISRTNATSQTINQLEAQSLTPGECRQMDLTGATPASSKTTNMTFGSMATSPNSSEGIGSDSTMKSCIREGNQGP